MVVHRSNTSLHPCVWGQTHRPHTRGQQVGGGGFRAVLQGGVGKGGGSRTQKNAPHMARPDVPNSEFRFFLPHDGHFGGGWGGWALMPKKNSSPGVAVDAIKAEREGGGGGQAVGPALQTAPLRHQ